MADKYKTLAELLGAALVGQLKPYESFGDLFTEDATFEFPFAPAGTPKQLTGRAAIIDHLARLGPLIAFGDFTLSAVYRCADTTIFEASCQGEGVDTGLAYDQKYVAVITVRDGQIARYADYWNPLVLLHALGGQEAVEVAYARGASAA